LLKEFYEAAGMLRLSFDFDVVAANRSGENVSALKFVFPSRIQSQINFAVTGASRIPFR
jgi:hypothetical protein